MSERCYNCFRPIQFCLCKYAKQIDCGVKFVLLMHPKEAKRQRTGTGRITKVSLVSSEILVGLDFANNKRLSTLLNDEKYFSVLLYPGKNTWNANTKELHINLQNKTLLVLVVDATWFCARKIIEHNPFLLELPRISFCKKYTSEFTFKREPKEDYISTIESCYYLIKELQNANLINKEVNADSLLYVFRKMIRDQLQAQNDRIDGKLPNTHAYNHKYTKKISEDVINSINSSLK